MTQKWCGVSLEPFFGVFRLFWALFDIRLSLRSHCIGNFWPLSEANISQDDFSSFHQICPKWSQDGLGTFWARFPKIIAYERSYFKNPDFEHFLKICTKFCIDPSIWRIYQRETFFGVKKRYVYYCRLPISAIFEIVKNRLTPLKP